MSVAPLVVIPLAAYALLTQEEKDAIVVRDQRTSGGVPQTSGYGTPAKPGQNKLPVSNAKLAAVAGRVNPPASPAQSYYRAVNPYVTTGGGNWYTQAKATADQRVQELEQDLKKEYDKLGADAKKAGADALNKALDLEPPLEGDEKWEVIVERAAAAAGVAACAAVPGVQLAAPLCGIAAAYLAAQAHEWLKEKWGDIEGWAEKQWEGAKDKVEGVVDDIAGWIGF